MPGKIKKRVTLFEMNHETGVPEIELVGAVAAHIGVSAEDFMRGATLQAAARYLQDMEAHRVAAEAAYEAAHPGATHTSKESADGPANQEGSSSSETEEAGAAADPAPV